MFDSPRSKILFPYFFFRKLGLIWNSLSAIFSKKVQRFTQTFFSLIWFKQMLITSKKIELDPWNLKRAILKALSRSMQKIEKLTDLGKFSSQSLTGNKTRNRPKYFFLRRAVFTMGVGWKASTGQGLFPYGYQPHHGSCIKLIYHTTRFHEKQIWTWSKYLSWFRFSGVSP